MLVEKVINNNVVTAIDEANQEVVLMGKGIGFQAKPGKEIAREKIEKKFVLSNKAEIGKFEELVSAIPIEHLDVCIEIINYATNVLGKRISSSIYISLTDHINFALERYKTGIVFDNPLAQEVKSFYRNEYLVGEYAVTMIEQKLGIRLPGDEAASIAMHFLNAEYNTVMSDTMHITSLIREIIELVEGTVQKKMNDTKMDYSRFVTHLKFLALRMFSGEEIEKQDEEYNNMVIYLYPRAFSVVEKVAYYTKNKYNYNMTLDEQVNMTIHIRRIYPSIEKE
ncbi:MAG: PRD domain-containing protein [Agathobacter sp.]|nr:PRD domain-containing protein [Agathobacter sp.]